MPKKKRVELTLVADFAPQLNGREIVSFGVGPQNEVLLLATTRPVKAEALGRVVQPGWASFPLSKTAFYRAGILQFTPDFQGEIALGTEAAHPFIQPLPNGEILIVAARCHFRDGHPEQNAAVYNGDGTPARRFVLGDGLEYVWASPDGSIWAGYFDEGVFGNYGWNEPLGADGILRLNAQGEILWRFTAPTGFDSIADCYALNVAPDAIWACPYTDFPIVRINSDGQSRAWKNEFGGARAIVSDNHRVLLFGGYGKERSRCVVQDFGDHKMKNAREIELKLPFKGNLEKAHVHNRGSILHFFLGSRWLQFDLAQHDI